MPRERLEAELRGLLVGHDTLFDDIELPDDFQRMDIPALVLV